VIGNETASNAVFTIPHCPTDACYLHRSENHLDRVLKRQEPGAELREVGDVGAGSPDSVGRTCAAKGNGTDFLV